MTAVEILVRNPETAATERIARLEVSVLGGPAVLVYVRPDWAGMVEDLLRDGVPTDEGGRLYLVDGEALLAALPDVYRGSRFWAAPAA